MSQVTMSSETYKSEINRMKKEHDITIVAHFYQRDEVYELGDITGDSLELGKRAMASTSQYIVFCGVGFMGQSVKLLSPQTRVFMPRIACCSMARMIDTSYYDNSIKAMNSRGIKSENILPVTYINSSAEVKAEVGKMGGLVCTSSNAKVIIEEALKAGKKIFFLPDRCLGQNIAIDMGLRSAVIGIDEKLEEADIICFDGFCSVHQLFTPKDIDFYRKKFPGIKIATHPECDPSVCKKSDFVGSTSQIIKYVASLDPEQKVAVGTEFNLVNRLRPKNTYVLSATKPECPTMNETTLEELYNVMKSIEDETFINEIEVEDEVIKWGAIALQRMMDLS
jgi:quinolinate synthase